MANLKSKSKRRRYSAKSVMRELEAEIKREETSFPYRMYKRVYRLIWNNFYINDMWRDILAFIQRGKRGWANRDVWGFGKHLSKIILEGLKHLKQYQNGHPGDLTEEQWIDILNQIIYTFETAYDIWDGDVYYMALHEWDEKRYQEMLTYSKTKDAGIKKILNKKEARELEEGFKLFNKYFFSLWD